MSISRVTSRARVTVPKEIREQLGLKPGDPEASCTGAAKSCSSRNLPLFRICAESIQARQMPEDFGLIRERVRMTVARRRAGTGGSG
jgi:hypothetical protein